MNPKGNPEKLMAEHASHLENDLKTTDHIHEADLAEHNIGLWEAVKSNPKIIILTAIAQIGPFAYGFDSIAFSLCLAMPPFQETFGYDTGDGSYLIPAYWQTLWNAVTQIAITVGALCTGTLGEAFGRRVTFFAGAAISMAGVAVAYISDSRGEFLGGKIINGFGLGLLNTIGVTYISEIAPLRLRGVCLSAMIFSTNLGCLIATSIAYALSKIPNSAAYKILFATEWIWPAIMILSLYFMPESPHHLVKKGKMQKAARALGQLRGETDNIQALLDAIILVHEMEKSTNSQTASSFLLAFKGTNWRRTRIIIYLNALSQLIGASFVNNAPYFLIQAGLSSSRQSMIIEIGFALGCVTSMITWLFLESIGRRPLLYTGMASAALLYLAMGIAGCFKSSGALWAVGILIMVVICTNGPVVGAATSIAGEISQTELRATSQTIGFTFNFFFATVWQVVIPYMFNSDEGNLGGKMGFIFFATSTIGLLLVYLEVPETKGRSFAELDEMFSLGLPTKVFKTHPQGARQE